MADIIKKDIGAVSAYALAVEGGYTGTEDEFRADMANLAGNVAQVAADKLAAAQSATDADASKTAAQTAKAAAETAKAKAEAAQAAAENAKADAETAKAEAKTSADNSAVSAAAAADSATEAAQTLASIPEDYSALNQSVSELNNDLVQTESRLSESITEIDGLLFVSGKNLLNPNIPSDHVGKFINPSNGAVNANADYSYTDFCEIPTGTIILYCKSNTGNIVTQAFIAFYDKGKRFISGASSAVGVQSFTVPSDAKYFVWSGKTSRMNGTEYKTMVSTDANDVYEDYTGKGFNYKTIDARNDIIVVAKERGQYTSVTEAVQNAKDGDTILVYPAVYDNETVEAWGKEVHIIGLSRERCIIKNHEATYSTPPIEIGKGTLENLTIIAEYGSGASKDSNGWFPYAVHSEDNNLENGILTIRNCTLISELNAGFGLGMRGGCTVNIDNCELIGRNGSGNRSLFFHDSASATYKGEQNINIVNSQLISSSASQHTLRIVDQNVDGSRVNVRFVNTLVHNSSSASTRLGTSVQGGATGSGWRNLVNVYLDGASYGNNIAAMNAV